MPATNVEEKFSTHLRDRAEVQLQGGTALAMRGWTIGSPALEMLYRLASHSESAGDALKLLHELQVHQVELDLQQEQWMENQREISDDLARYSALFEFAPIAYLAADGEGRITEANLAGSELLRTGRDELIGRRVESFLEEKSRQAFAVALGRLKDGDSTVACEVESSEAEGAPRRWRMVATLAPGGRAVLVALVDEPARSP